MRPTRRRIYLSTGCVSMALLVAACPDDTPSTTGSSSSGDDPGTETSSNDIEAGRLRANELARPYGFQGASPGQRFASRSPISEEERAAFEAAVQKRFAGVLAKQGLLPFAPLTRQERNAVRRAAIALALVDRGILQIRRRRFTPPFTLRFP